MNAHDPYLEAELRRALATDPRVLEPELDVHVLGAKVVASGMVPTEERRDAVRDVLLEHCGDLEVDNQVVVASFDGSPQEETLT